MSEEVRDKALVADHTLIANPALIRVMAIKKKFVQQIPDVNSLGQKALLRLAFEVIGQTTSHVVMRFEEKLYKAHRTDYLDFLRNHFFESLKQGGHTPPAAEYYEKAEEMLRGVPQLFEE